MAITQAPFGLHHEQQVTAYTLTNGNGCRARLISFGARLVEMHAPDKNGKVADIVLGFDALEPYLTTDTYFGATCGRYGNRIKKGQFQLDGQAIQVACNEAPNHLHGGEKGLDKYVWDASVDETENSVTFSHVSKKGDAGFPGELLLKAKYTLTEDNRLLITMSGITDETTILNMVHHSYWNVAGHDTGTVVEQMLTVESDFYTPVGDQLLATGEVLTVAGTPFDFRSAKLIGQDIGNVANAGVGHLTVSELGGGYDHNWVLRGASPAMHPVATLWDPVSGRGIHLKSTEPGVQIYTGGYLSAAVIGKGNKPYCTYAGLTFETQKFPDSPNFAHFPTTRLEPGETYCHEMEIQFFARET
ncbi:aldose epimerase family protein [Pseudomonas sp. GB2N2]